MKRHNPGTLLVNSDQSYSKRPTKMTDDAMPRIVVANETDIKHSNTKQTTMFANFAHCFDAGKKYPNTSHKAMSLNEKVARFIVKDLRPYSIVDSKEFIELLRELDPRYTPPKRTTFSERIIPNIYKEVKSDVQKQLANALQVALTTDGWTSCATDSYITITSSHLNREWQIVNFILQTRILNQSHTAQNLADILKEAVQEWQLPSVLGFPPVTTDNAPNVTKSVVLCESFLHVPCLAHTINLAVSKSLKVENVRHVLAKVRRVAAFFHRSPKASALLRLKAELLSLPSHDLIIDVITRWNSAFDMLVRYLEMQPAIVTVLLEKEMCKAKGDLSMLTDEETVLANDLVDVLRPMKEMTVLVCSENSPTVSVIMPLKHQMMNVILTPKESDSETLADVKKVMHEDFKMRFQKQEAMLLVTSAMDPKFKNLSFLKEDERNTVWGDVIEQTSKLIETSRKNSVVIKTEHDDEVDAPPLPTLPDVPVTNQSEHVEDDNQKETTAETDPQLPQNIENKHKPASILEGLLGDVCIVKTEPAQSKSPYDLAKLETDRYWAEPGIQVNSNSLDWWRQHEDQYPHLAQLARALLCIQATSVPSERAFSTAGDIVSHQRASMKPANVDILLFLKKNWK